MEKENEKCKKIGKGFDAMKRNRVMILSSILIPVASLLLPFKVSVGNEIQLGYPFGFLTIFKSAFSAVNTGWHPTVLKLISINLLSFCLDVVAIYILMIALEKIRGKLAK